jgi:uncharacterized protein YeaO (DUF488 family)
MMTAFLQTLFLQTLRSLAGVIATRAKGQSRIIIRDAMAIAIKRVYEAPAPADGVRVLVDRLWPRGLTKADAAVKDWLREIAPSNELRQWYHANPDAWALFRKRYLKELTSAEATAAVEKLHDLAEGKKKLTLLYASRDEEHNNATVLKELLEGSRKPPSSVGRVVPGRDRIRKKKQ